MATCIAALPARRPDLASRLIACSALVATLSYCLYLTHKSAFHVMRLVVGEQDLQDSFGFDAIGADRVGVRLSSNGETQGVRDSDPLALFKKGP